MIWQQEWKLGHPGTQVPIDIAGHELTAILSETVSVASSREKKCHLLFPALSPCEHKLFKLTDTRDFKGWKLLACANIQCVVRRCAQIIQYMKVNKRDKTKQLKIKWEEVICVTVCNVEIFGLDFWILEFHRIGFFFFNFGIRYQNLILTRFCGY